MIYVEIIFLIAIILGQVYYFRKTLLLIRRLRQIFPKSAWGIDQIGKVEKDTHQISTISVTNNQSPEFAKIIKDTNDYLINNYGSAEFNTIKSIAEQETELLEAQVTASIATPLYLGLMGTFIGVILGLGTMIADDGQLLQHMEIHINDLLMGVCVAMGVSLIGLALTTVNNVHIFKLAVVERDERKSRYVSFLHIYLLPGLDNNLHSALSSLKQNITGFNEDFKTNLELFNSSFGTNITSLAKSVGIVSENIDRINENQKAQTEFLKELKEINYEQIAKANLDVLKKLENISPLLTEFTEAQSRLNGNITETNEFVTKLQAVFDRMSTFEQSINQLGTEINQAELFGADTIIAIRKQLAAIGRNESIITEYTDKAEAEIREYLRNGTEKIAELRRKIESDFEHAFDFDAKGNVLQNLNYLKTMDQTLTEVKGEMQTKLGQLLDQAEKEEKIRITENAKKEQQLRETESKLNAQKTVAEQRTRSQEINTERFAKEQKIKELPAIVNGDSSDPTITFEQPATDATPELNGFDSHAVEQENLTQSSSKNKRGKRRSAAPGFFKRLWNRVRRKPVKNEQ